MIYLRAKVRFFLINAKLSGEKITNNGRIALLSA